MPVRKEEYQAGRDSCVLLSVRCATRTYPVEDGEVAPLGLESSHAHPARKDLQSDARHHVVP